MIEIFIQSLLIGYSGALMPGSLLTYTLQKSIKSGAKAGFLISIGHALLELVLVVLLFMGAGQYLKTDPVQILIGLIGGMVLAYFGFTMVREAYLDKVSIAATAASEGKNGNTILNGALISASNPYFIIWWAAVGLGLIMTAYNSFGLIGIIVFYVGHILADFSWYVSVSAIIGKSRNFISQKVYRLIIAILGLCLLGFALSFIVASVRLIFK